MLETVADVLECPHCGSSLTLTDRRLLCPAGHAFDLARQGYVNLARRPAPAAADTREMVEARLRVQGSGHHAALTAALVRVASEELAHHPPAGDPASGLVVDLGAGTGHHLAAVLEATGAPAGLALDVSKHAARHAARAHPRIGAVVCDVWERLPVRTGVAGLVLNVFAPRNVAEITRLSATQGALVVATPTARHLAPLVERLGLLRVGDDKLDRLDAALAGFGRLHDRTEVETAAALDHGLVDAVVAMGPSAHHLSAEQRAQHIARLPDLVEVTLSVTVSVYRRA